MKLPLLLISILFYLPVIAQPANDTLQFAKLVPITYNYKNCKVTIMAGNWQPFKRVSELPLTITVYNNSADTLKYGLWTTNFLNYYVHRVPFMIAGSGSEILHNFLQVFTLARINRPL